MLSRSEVEHVAALARLELSEEEKELFAQQLREIIEYVNILQELPTDDVPPLVHVVPLKNVWREDEVEEHLEVEEVLSRAPDREERFFRVSRVV
ncbi:Asp-tRNA(Asn)/Glu-tRNA(Gln) amidotransferase subunit GatC [Ammonifex thiophilus]|uniref:Aspartyl/glutamyl-tRNA(Asn/Gln) amidotransferase subunit C n=1 Tax=Ammonifex thiophilus TaxID=444093 RepID=A0A3D8P6P2_9THEO|nr:Asp-tRNA(Asn)/Glu-tRNA(Gln) amidotransferase subunit GatC [Ammonifex thiophilus]RDV84024.1 Asp-tRNA(Asn)/Glu-tRNA(Gln) amidotransferase subunit GatC [Ammonifex thiophilus]